jgi:hypothetical protein
MTSGHPENYTTLTDVTDRQFLAIAYACQRHPRQVIQMDHGADHIAQSFGAYGPADMQHGQMARCGGTIDGRGQILDTDPEEGFEPPDGDIAQHVAHVRCNTQNQSRTGIAAPQPRIVTEAQPIQRAKPGEPALGLHLISKRQRGRQAAAQ